MLMDGVYDKVGDGVSVGSCDGWLEGCVEVDGNSVSANEGCALIDGV